MSMSLPAISTTAVASSRAAAPGRWNEGLFHLLALAGAGMVILGSYLPWATFYAGLVERNGVPGHGKYFIGLAAAAALAAAISAVRGGSPIRWLVPLFALGVAFYAARDLRNLYALQDDPSAALYLPGRGDGLYVVLAGAALLFAAFLVSPRMPLRGVVNLPVVGLALGAALAVVLLVPGLYGEYYLHLGSGGHQAGHTNTLNIAHVLTFSGVAVALAAQSAFMLRLGHIRRA